MGSGSQTAPYGTWKSPITADLLASKGISLKELGVNESNAKIYFIESRPAESGRYCIVEHNTEGKNRDVLPKEYSAETGVHEYGGGGFVVGSDGNIIFSDWTTKGVFSLVPDSSNVTPILKADTKVYFANFNIHPLKNNWILAVREDHTPKEVENTVVAINSETQEVHTIARGADFYSHPQFSPDGETVCWMQWDHPDMPWSGTLLYVANWNDENLEGAKLVAGKAQAESISQPRWARDGSLLFASDRTGYWQLYRREVNSLEIKHIKLKGLENAEFAGPEWYLGSCTYASLTPKTIIAAVTKDAAETLIVIDVETDTYTNLEYPLVTIVDNAVRRVSDTSFVVIGQTMTGPSALFYFDIKDSSKNKIIRKCVEIDLPTSLFSIAQHISFPRLYGNDKNGEAYALYLPPNNPDYEPVAGTLPPLIVSMHGGPTLNEGPGLSLPYQYYTSRGYAVALVNYTGSSGYGRAFRDALNGEWGVSDLADGASCVSHLVSTKKVDASRCGVRGASAGGYATLESLCIYPKVWAGGVSYYGIGDLKGLMDDTHKFESQYINSLLWKVGTPEERQKAILHDRSPCYHADQIEAAVLLMQGSADKIVPPDQAHLMAKIIEGNGGTVKVIIFPGEGHGFQKGEHVKASMEEEEKWWVKTLLR